MNYEEATTILDQNYGSFSNNITSSLTQSACITLARMCQEGTVRKFNQSTLTNLSKMNEEKQSSWLANPFMEFLWCSLRNQMTKPATPIPVSVNPVNPVNSDKPKPNEKPKPELKPIPKQVEPEPEEEMGLSLFD